MSEDAMKQIGLEYFYIPILTTVEESEWKADLNKFLDNEFSFKQLILMSLLNHHNLGDSLEHFCESTWIC